MPPRRTVYLSLALAFGVLCLVALPGYQRRIGPRRQVPRGFTEADVLPERKALRIDSPAGVASPVEPSALPRKRLAAQNAALATEFPEGENIELDPTEPISPDAPPAGSAILPDQAHQLLTGTVRFDPQSIPSSGTPVAPDTRLDLGQDLQVLWGGNWWAASIRGFEPDGKVRIHYFGWADTWDEAKDRSELQLDLAARVHALDSTYKRGW